MHQKHPPANVATASPRCGRTCLGLDSATPNEGAHALGRAANARDQRNAARQDTDLYEAYTFPELAAWR
ncbi:MAG: hypothetical protein MJD61_12660 [Proteobacteria bacterium]|nr:hypothetical protein [Pseudomonadota bacterium]